MNIYDKLKPPNHQHILGTCVNTVCYEDTINQVMALATSEDYCYVCAANVHMVMEAYDSEDFRKIINIIWISQFIHNPGKF